MKSTIPVLKCHSQLNVTGPSRLYPRSSCSSSELSLSSACSEYSSGSSYTWNDGKTCSKRVTQINLLHLLAYNDFQKYFFLFFFLSHLKHLSKNSVGPLSLLSLFLSLSSLLTLFNNSLITPICSQSHHLFWHLFCFSQSKLFFTFFILIHPFTFFFLKVLIPLWPSHQYEVLY